VVGVARATVATWIVVCTFPSTAAFSTTPLAFVRRAVTPFASRLDRVLPARQRASRPLGLRSARLEAAALDSVPFFQLQTDRGPVQELPDDWKKGGVYACFNKCDPTTRTQRKQVGHTAQKRWIPRHAALW
jgi:hypothetical protein